MDTPHPMPTKAALAELARAYLDRRCGGVSVDARIVVRLHPDGAYEVTIDLDDPPAATAGPRVKAVHSPDYRVFDSGDGASYQFGPTQAAAVRVLHEAWVAGQPVLSQEAVLEAADSDSSRLADVFRRHPAWGVLIVPAGGGMYRLALGE